MPWALSSSSYKNALLALSQRIKGQKVCKHTGSIELFKHNCDLHDALLHKNWSKLQMLLSTKEKFLSLSFYSNTYMLQNSFSKMVKMCDSSELTKAKKIARNLCGSTTENVLFPAHSSSHLWDTIGTHHCTPKWTFTP